MYSLLLPAKIIPIETKVTKPNGTKKYILKNDIKIYAKGIKNKRKIDLPDNCLFLVTEEYINIIPDDTMLCISFDTITGLKKFVNDLYGRYCGK